MIKGLETLKDIKQRLVDIIDVAAAHNDTLRVTYCLNTKEDFERYVDNIIGVKTIEKELTLLQDLLGHVTDLYIKKELDYYADREPFYYDYYIVFDNTPLKVSKDLYDEVRKQLDLPNKCVDW